MLNLHLVCLRFLYVPESQTEIIEGSVPVLLTKAQDGTLEPKGTEIEELDATLHGLAATMPPARRQGVTRKGK